MKEIDQSNIKWPIIENIIYIASFTLLVLFLPGLYKLFGIVPVLFINYKIVMK